MSNLLICNLHTCPVKGKQNSQCHLLDLESMTVSKSFPKMEGHDLELFAQYKSKLIINVNKVADLSVVKIETE